MGDRTEVLDEVKRLLNDRYQLDDEQVLDYLVAVSLQKNINVLQAATHVMRVEGEEPFD